MTPPRLTPLLPRLALLCLLLGGCATTDKNRGKPLVPALYLTRTGPYSVWTNEPIAADAPAVRELSALEQQVQRQLGLRVDPQAAPIEVYILDNQRTFEHFLRFYYPELPARRAFFLARADRRVVYTYFGDRLVEDLRHEATHALLNGSAATLPLWLDEGLAEYFEVAEGQGGLNLEHLARLPGDRGQGWTPDLVNLERLQDVREMSPRDYREAWAWAHYLLDGSSSNRQALLGYIADLRSDSPAKPLSDRIETSGPAADEVLAHLDSLGEGHPAEVLERDMVYRLQNPVADSPSRPASLRPRPAQDPRPYTTLPPPRRRSFFGRVFDLFR